MIKPSLLIISLSLLSSTALAADPVFTRTQLEAMARDSSRAIRAANNQVDAARSAIDTAGAFPNPEIEYQKGSARARIPGVTNTGDVRSSTLTQPLDMPWVRSPRIAGAEAGFEAASATGRVLIAEHIARLRTRYFELLRRQAELDAAKEAEELMDGIRSRIALRVETGEAPRFELIKADTELLNAQKNVRTAESRLVQTRAALRSLVGAQLPENFQISGRLEEIAELGDMEKIREEIRQQNPELQTARALKRQAEKKLDFERAQRLPSLSLKASRDIDNELRTSMVGLAITIPLWDRRKGPVGEAVANLERARNELEYQEFATDRGVEVAYEQLEIAQAQVSALESGIVRQAENALRIAEAAYRFGEHGILEVLDAQRVYRAARSDLIAARFELASAWIEIERLRATPP